MKKIIALALAASIALTGCGAPQTLTTADKTTKEYPTYGLFNENSEKSSKVCYEISVGNVVWSILLIETVVMPIYFIGFSLFNPVSAKSDKGCGIDAG